MTAIAQVHNTREFLVTELLLLVGLLIVASFAIKATLRRTVVPPMVGYMLLGVAVQAFGDALFHFSDDTDLVFELLATIGLACLLFRVGLESDLPALLRQLRPASLLWIGNLVASFVLAYFAARELLGLDQMSSLFAGTALSATSIGISVGAWREAKALATREGEMLVDVAELDDISAIIVMSLLVGIAPTIAKHGEDGQNNSFPFELLVAPLGWLLLKLVAFVVGCILFSRYLEAYLSRFLERVRMPQDAMLTVAGTGFVIAALASFAGFAVAIGAFFAGLIFSRDPEAVRYDARFASVYALFTPFFFVGVGMHLDVTVLHTAWEPGLVLLAAAIVGKVLGTALPALLQMNGRRALLLGVSMVPRSEIAMAVASAGLAAGCISQTLFASIALVAAVTSLITPVAVRWMLVRSGIGGVSGSGDESEPSD